MQKKGAYGEYNKHGCRFLAAGAKAKMLMSSYLTILIATTPPKFLAAENTDVVRTGVGTVKSGLEFKGLKRAGTALIFGRGVKTLTFTLHSHSLPLHLFKEKEGSNTMQRGDI